MSLQNILKRKLALLLVFAVGAVPFPLPPLQLPPPLSPGSYHCCFAGITKSNPPRTTAAREG